MANDSQTHVATVARAANGLLDAATVLLTDRRIIVVAQGKQFWNSEMPEDRQVPDTLIREGMAITPVSGKPQTWEYVATQQGVVYELRVTTNKKEFIDALMTPGFHVIFAGHARYGRGPCFGGPEELSEEWENGDSPYGESSNGIFRMGHPYIGIDIHEVYTHGYTAQLEPASRLKAADCDPEMGFRQRVASNGIKKGTLAEIDAKTPDSIRTAAVLCSRCNSFQHSLANHVSGVSATDTVGYYMRTDNGVYQPHLVLRAHWNNTACTPSDLGARMPLCKVFCHFGCSTYQHNYPVVRHMASWKREGDNHYAYWTTAAARMHTPVYWLKYLFTYPKYNAFMPWKESIEYAAQKTKAALARDARGWSII